MDIIVRQKNMIDLWHILGLRFQMILLASNKLAASQSEWRLLKTTRHSGQCWEESWRPALTDSVADSQVFTSWWASCRPNLAAGTRGYWRPGCAPIWMAPELRRLGPERSAAGRHWGSLWTEEHMNPGEGTRTIALQNLTQIQVSLCPLFKLL